MKIQSIETFTNRSICIVRIKTDDGAEGIGQTAPFNADITAMVLHRQVAPHILGRESANIDELVDMCIEREYKFPGSYINRAVGGIDTALWDLKGKVKSKSVCELLGGKPRLIDAYGSSGRWDIPPRDEADRLVRLRDSQGYKAFKLRIGSICGHDVDQWPGRTEELVPMVHSALGNDISILVDANSCYTPHRAIEVGRMLENNGVCHFEEPCPWWEIEWTAEVAAALDVPVAGGEQDHSLAQWRRMITMHSVDIVQPDICYVGGLTRALRVAAMAEKAGLPCVPHSANLSMVTIFTLHMMGAIHNAGPYLEFSIESSSWMGDLYSPVLHVDNGKVAIPDGPGWGVTVNDDWLAQADRQVSKIG